MRSSHGFVGYSKAGMGANVRALVIDDDRLMCQFLAEYLAPSGYTVTAAHTDPDGAAKAVSPDVDVPA